MGRGAWWATVHGAAQSDMTEASYHIPTMAQVPTPSDAPQALHKAGPAV